MQAPLVFGVTGHRDLRPEDMARLEAKVGGIFLAFRAQYPSTPFVLLSPLAEGADRLVARVALASGVRLIAPLPLAQSLYERDFETQESLSEFRDLLGLADEWFELDLLGEIDAVMRGGTARDLEYEKAGKYIASTSQILIALWDGEDPGKVGGTAAIVRFQTEGIRDRSECDLLPPELFPVYHIITPRLSNPAPPGEALDLRVIYPSAFEKKQDAERYYQRLFGNLDDFNAELLEGGEPLSAAARTGAARIIGEGDGVALSEHQWWTLQRCAFADVLALRYHKRMMWANRLVHWLVFFAFLFFVIFAHGQDHPIKFLFSSGIVLVCAVGIYLLARMGRWDDKYQDYRAVAEGCRVRFFWQIAGICYSVADNYLGKQRTELDWVRNGLRGWNIDQYYGFATTTAERVQFVLKNWINAQIEFFERAEQNIERPLSKVMELLAPLFVALAAIGAFLVFCYALKDWPDCVNCEWVDTPLIVIDALLAAGALLHHAHDRQAHEQHHKQYARIGGIFKSAMRVIGPAIDRNDPVAAQRCLRKLGQEALAENGDWVLLHRERPLELPHP